MNHSGVAGSVSRIIGPGRLPRAAVVLLPVVLVLGVTMLGTGLLTSRAQGSDLPRCERFAVAAQHRADRAAGHGPGVVVIGDSWSVGLGLRRPSESWPSRLPGRVRVAGFSGSGFSAHASGCGPVSFADRAPGALRPGTRTVVVEGGLNDFDQPDAAIRAGFARLMSTLHPRTAAYDVVVVGPAMAPSRAARVPHVDALLGRLSEQYGVGYVSTTDLRLPYLHDGLHLTRAGHRVFGDAVAERVSALGSTG